MYNYFTTFDICCHVIDGVLFSKKITLASSNYMLVRVKSCKIIKSLQYLIT